MGLDISGLQDFSEINARNPEKKQGQEPQNKQDETKKDAKLSRIESLTLKKKQIEAQIAKIKAQEKQKERKDDTRRKIILGGFLMTLIEKDAEAKRIYQACIKSLNREQDKKLFE